MKWILFLFVSLIAITGCRKMTGAAKVEIYLLQSYNTVPNPGNPDWVSITNAVLQDTPFVRNEEIQYYDQQTHIYHVNSNIKQDLVNFGPDKAFAIAVNGQPVYYGRFHPGYLSSMTIGLATIDPVIMGDQDLEIRFVHILASPVLTELDKRNDPAILNAFRATGRLR